VVTRVVSSSGSGAFHVPPVVASPPQFSLVSAHGKNKFFFFSFLRQAQNVCSE